MLSILSLLLLAVVGSSCAQTKRVVEPPLRVDLQPPEEATRMNTRNVELSSITMPIDHFDPLNGYTYQMRYMMNEEFFGGEGLPIFIMVGGEWTIASGWLVTGNMYEMARENHGYMVYTEHRYYGESLPFQNFTAENLRFLNADQALADLAFFIRDMKTQPRFANSKVILYGGSYAANMALWFKQRYPDLAYGAVASSGPIKAELDFTGYLEVVHNSFRSEGGEQCIDIIRQGIQQTVEAMRTEEGRRTLERDYRLSGGGAQFFSLGGWGAMHRHHQARHSTDSQVIRLCGPLDYDNRLDLGYFAGLISWTFSTSVQQARPGTLINICDNFRGYTYGNTSMQKIGGYIAAIRGLGTNGCWSLTFEAYVAAYQVERSESKAWYYQTCTEYGYYQTAPRSGTVFDPLEWLNVEFYVELCKRAFDESFDEAFVQAAVDRVNESNGGLSPNVTNTINIHGMVDPWHALGVHDRDLNDGSPTYTVPRASHCFDMQSWLATDTIRMTAAQQKARRLVAQWLA